MALSMDVSTGYFPLLRPRFIRATGKPGQHRSGLQTSMLKVCTGNVFLALCQPLTQQELEVECKVLHVAGKEL